MAESKKDKKNIFRYWLYDFTLLTAMIPGLIAFRPKWMYESEKAKERIRGGALLIGNHVGFFDPVYMMFAVWYRRHHFICTKEFFEGKKAFLFRNFQCIPIDRDNFNVGSFKIIVDHLKNDEIVSMFPEGHINSEGGIATFKSGMILMALQSKKPIVPVYVHPRKNVLHRFKMVVGEPIDISAEYKKMPTMSEIEEISKRLHEKEETLRALCEK